jgi:Fe-S cluster assembly protein SufD
MSSPALKSLQAAFEAKPDVTPNQRSAFAAFLAAGLPTAKLDAWKYTDLRRFALKQFKPGIGGELQAADLAALLPFESAHRLVFINGVLQPHSIASAEVKVGIAKPGTAPLPLPFPGNAFALLNAALATETVHVSIADDCTLQSPIYVAHVWNSTAAEMRHPRISITLGSRSKATLIEQQISTQSDGRQSEPKFSNQSLEIRVGTGASLAHVRVQEDGENNFDIGSVVAYVEELGHYANYQFAIGSSLSRHDIDVHLVGQEARTELHGLLFAQTTQHLDVRSCIRHEVPNTQSREDYRGIADQRGRIVFNGKVIVAKDAQRTDAAQSSRNLLLSAQAEIDTRPELEIYANDVKCAHGATVGQLDAAALFYLQSRGIGLGEARALLTHAFAAEIIERVPETKARQRVLDRLMQRMRSPIIAEATL